MPSTARRKMTRDLILMAPLYTRVPQHIHKAIVKLAAKKSKTLSMMVRELIEKGIED